MPLGTENLLSRHFGYTRDPAQVRDTIRHGMNKLLDVGLANGRMFLVMVTCGFDAEVVRAMHLTRQGHINRFSYFGPIMRALQRYRFPPLDVEWLEKPFSGCDCESSLSLGDVFSNLPRYAASLRIETLAQGDDGQLDFCGLQRGGLWHGLRYLGGIAMGRHISGAMSRGARSLVAGSHRLRRSRTRSMGITEASCRLKSRSCHTI